jgi:hypothetical protein
MKPTASATNKKFEMKELLPAPSLSRSVVDLRPDAYMEPEPRSYCVSECHRVTTSRSAAEHAEHLSKASNQTR